MTVAPSRARSIATARPMPREAPVTSAMVPSLNSTLHLPFDRLDRLDLLDRTVTVEVPGQPVDRTGLEKRIVAQPAVDSAVEAAERLAVADLHVDRDAEPQHGPDAVDPTHRLGELIDHGLPHGRHVG